MQLLGRTRIKPGLVRFYRCPGCGTEAESFNAGRNHLVLCHVCRGKFRTSGFAVVRRRRSVAVCTGCRRDVSLSPANEGWLGHICSHCQSYVTIHYGNRRLPPHIPLRVSWNKGARVRARVVRRNLRFLTCRSKRDFLIVNVLQVLAQQEDSPFRSVSQGEHQAALLFGANRSDYVGYLVWTEQGVATLRQIFVRPAYRRRGYASEAVRFWAKHYAEPLGPRFGVESPNTHSLRMLTKLGYARIKGSGVIGVKCFFIPSGL